MKTQEQVSVIGDFTVGGWNDVAMRETLWASLRDKVADCAARDGKVLTDTPGVRTSPVFMRITDAGGGELAEVECAREEAEFVRLRLSCWAEAK